MAMREDKKQTLHELTTALNLGAENCKTTMEWVESTTASRLQASLCMKKLKAMGHWSIQQASVLDLAIIEMDRTVPADTMVHVSIVLFHVCNHVCIGVVVRMAQTLEEVDKTLGKAMELFETCEEQTIGHGGAFRAEAFGAPEPKGKGKGTKDIEVSLENVKWIEEGWVNGYKVFIGDLPGNIGKLDLDHVTQGQVDICINANATRSGMVYAIVTFTTVAEAVECFKRASVLKLDHGNGHMHWASAKWYQGKKARAKSSWPMQP